MVDDLRPGQLVVVTYPEGRRNRQPTSPDPLEAGLLHDARRESAVRLHQEGDVGPADQPFQRGRTSNRHETAPFNDARKRSRISAGLYGIRGTSASSAVVLTSTKCVPGPPSAARIASPTSVAAVRAFPVR